MVIFLQYIPTNEPENLYGKPYIWYVEWNLFHKWVSIIQQKISWKFFELKKRTHIIISFSHSTKFLNWLETTLFIITIRNYFRSFFFLKSANSSWIIIDKSQFITPSWLIIQFEIFSFHTSLHRPWKPWQIRH